MSQKSEVFVVYVYVDYRKEIGTRILRTYKDREEAIRFAKSLSIEFKAEGMSPRTPQDEDEHEHEDEETIDHGSNYCIVKGTEFDAKLRLPSEQWPKYGLNDKHLWYLRIAVDKSDLF